MSAVGERCTTRSETPPWRWSQALAERAVPPFDPGHYGRLVVVAAHPDDETLGVAGTLRAARRAGAVITLVVATDGESAYPSFGPGARAELAQARRAELHAAHRLWVGIPDLDVAMDVPGRPRGALGPRVPAAHG